jgi:hypothetical protein
MTRFPRRLRCSGARRGTAWCRKQPAGRISGPLDSERIHRDVYAFFPINVRLLRPADPSKLAKESRTPKPSPTGGHLHWRRRYGCAFRADCRTVRSRTTGWRVDLHWADLRCCARWYGVVCPEPRNGYSGTHCRNLGGPSAAQGRAVDDANQCRIWRDAPLN